MPSNCLSLTRYGTFLSAIALSLRCWSNDTHLSGPMPGATAASAPHSQVPVFGNVALLPIGFVLPKSCASEFLCAHGFRRPNRSPCFAQFCALQVSHCLTSLGGETVRHLDAQ